MGATGRVSRVPSTFLRIVLLHPNCAMSQEETKACDY